jgi:hypothetical protein
MRRYIKTVVTTSGHIMANPIVNIEPEEGMVFLEFLIPEDNIKLDIIDTVSITNHSETYSYKIPQDGLYMYFREQIPVDIENVENYVGIYYGLYKENSESTGVETLMYKNEDGSVRRATGKDLKALVETYEGIPVFPICYISSCLYNLQRKFIFEGQKFNGVICNDEHAKLMRDFLFSTVYILRGLIRQQRFEEASRILDSVNGCVPLCETSQISNNYCRCK